MQQVQIIIRDGKVESVKINEKKERKTKKDIKKLLKTMPKESLGKALGRRSVQNAP